MPSLKQIAEKICLKKNGLHIYLNIGLKYSERLSKHHSPLIYICLGLNLLFEKIPMHRINAGRMPEIQQTGMDRP